MKLTWFGGTTLRIHIGGAIVVLNARAMADIDATELVSGADQIVDGFGESLAQVDLDAWRRRPAQRLIDSEEGAGVQAWCGGRGAVLIDAADEAPLLLLQEAPGRLGRWASGCVVVLFGTDSELIHLGKSLLEGVAPRLIALAGDDEAVEQAFAALRERLDGTGLVALERSMAVEV